MDLIINIKKYLLILGISISMVSCHESPGAICNDGHRSYSTGSGTCSWHGGVNHYIDKNDISVSKTAGLTLFLAFVGWLLVTENKKSNKSSK